MRMVRIITGRFAIFPFFLFQPRAQGSGRTQMFRRRTGGSFLWSWKRRGAFAGNLPSQLVAFLCKVGP